MSSIASPERTVGVQPQARRIVRHARRVIPLVALDSIILVSSYLTVYSVRTQMTLPATAVTFMVANIALLAGIFYLSGIYNRLWSRTSGHGVSLIVQTSLMNTVVALLMIFPVEPRPLPLSVVLVGNLLALTGFVAVRYRSRLISGLHWRWRAVWHHEFPYQEERVLIVGAGDAGQATAWRLKHRAPDRPQSYKVVGFVDDDPDKCGLFLEGCQVLGNRADISRLAAQHNVDLIVVAMNNVQGSDFRGILTECEKSEARIKIMPDMFELMHQTQKAPLLRDVAPEDLLGRQAIGRHEAVDMAPITGKIVLVTGAAGSIGSELCRQLLEYEPQKLVMLDNNESGLHDLLIELNQTAPHGVLVPFLADLTNRYAVEHVFTRHAPQVIFHSAAYKHVPMMERYPGEALRVNVGGTRLIAELAQKNHVERFVLISTDKAVKPSSVMGASKRVCELLMHAFSQQPSNETRFTAVRFGNVLGSRGSVVPTFSRQIDAGGPVTVTDPEMTRYFMTIPEAVNLVLHAACLTEGGDLFMLRMGEVVRIVELAERMIRMRGLRPYKDILIEFVGMRPGEKLHEELQEGHEASCPTIHPEIVELVNDRRNDLEPARCLEQVERLLQHDFGAESDPLHVLTDIIQQLVDTTLQGVPEAQTQPVESQNPHHQAGAAA